MIRHREKSGSGAFQRLIRWAAQRGCVWLLVLIPMTAFGQGGYSLGISSHDPFPKQLVDTVTYQLGIHLINHHPTQAFSGPVDFMMSVDGDEPSLLSSAVITSPIQPGDSLKLPFFSHDFNEARFTGSGGLTYDIIVWPMSAGIGQSDSLSHSVGFLHTQSSARKIELASPSGGFPGEIFDGSKYDLTFTVVNHDTVLSLYQPVSLSIFGNGIASYELLPPQKLKAPVPPGDSVTLFVPAHSFDITTGGGGLTYDIIVWPMAVGANDVDSLHRKVRIYDGAAIEIAPSTQAPVGNPVNSSESYEVILTVSNQGNIPSTEPIDLMVQVSDREPVVISTLTASLASGDSMIWSINPFSIPPEAIGQLSEGVYDMVLFARETSSLNWLNKIERQLLVEQPASAPPMIASPMGGGIEISWTLPLDDDGYSYEVIAISGPSPRLVARVPSARQAAPVTYRVYDAEPESGLNTYRLIRQDLHTQVRTILASARVSLSGRFIQGSMTGAPSEVTRTIHFSVEEATDVQLVWYDPTGRVLAEQEGHLPANASHWRVNTPTDYEGILFWTLQSGSGTVSGKTIRH